MNNFVFHEEYIIDIPSDRLAEFEHYIINYGLYHEEPTLSGLEQSFWMQIKRRIDQDNASYEINCLKRKINAIMVRLNNGKATEHDKENLIQFKTKLNELNDVKLNNSFKTKLNEKNDVKRTHHVIDIDNVIDNVIVNDIAIDIDNVIEQPQPVTKTTPSQANYSKKVFDIFSAAKLPCANNNEISFLMSDFKNALAFIHTSPELNHISSDDVINACKNYVKVLNDSSCYVSTKMNFYSLVKSKLFYNLLPQNFVLENFKSYKKDDAKNETKIDYYDALCPKCNEQKLYWSNDVEKFICASCNKKFKYEEIYK